MKKILLIPLMLLTMIPMAACSGSNADLILPEQQPENSGSGDEDDSTDPADPTPGGNGRYLVLYCSRTGSTERMAQQIQKILDCAGTSASVWQYYCTRSDSRQTQYHSRQNLQPKS